MIPNIYKTRDLILKISPTKRNKEFKHILNYCNRWIDRKQKSHKGLNQKYTKNIAKPTWTTLDEMMAVDEMYKFCRMLSHKTKISYSIDHIIPLRGENVCGLHHLSNLCIRNTEHNMEKGNSFVDI